MYATLEDIRETLTTSGAPGLVPKVIDRLLLEYQRKYSPLHIALPRKTWTTNQYLFNQRNQLPQAQATTEAPPTSGSGSVTPSQSNFTQNPYDVKHLQAQLDISTFAAKVAMVNGNLFDLELAGAARSMAWLESIYHMYGAQNATVNTKRPQWNGFDQQIGNANKINGTGAQVTLALLDNMIDAVKGVAAQELGTDWFFLLSNHMQSTINRAFVNQQRFNADMTKIFQRDDYGFPGGAITDVKIGVDAGMEVATYRGIPLVFASFLQNQGQMGAITTTNSTGSGSSLLAARTYSYVVEAVTRYGPLYASAEVSVTPSADAKNVVLSWTTPAATDAFGNVIDVHSYRIFRSVDNAGGSGAETLYALSSAYDLSDAAVTSFTDTGLIQDPTITAGAALYSATVAKSGANSTSDTYTYPRTAINHEDILLIPRNPEYLVVPVVSEIQSQMLAPVNARSRQFALTSDMTLAMRAGLFGAKAYNVSY